MSFSISCQPTSSATNTPKNWFEVIICFGAIKSRANASEICVEGIFKVKLFFLSMTAHLYKFAYGSTFHTL